MRCGNEELSGVMVSISRFAGTCVGTVAAAGKKITGAVTNGITSVGSLLARPIDTPELIAPEQTETTSEVSGVEANNKQNPELANSAKSLINVLESDLIDTRHKLQEVQSEKEALLSELKHARTQTNEAAISAGEAKTHADVLKILETNLAAAEKNNTESSLKEEQYTEPQPSSKTYTAQTEQEVRLPKPVEEVVETGEEKTEPIKENTAPYFDREEKTNRQPSQAISEIEMTRPSAVTNNQIQTAVFDKVTDKILFAKAVSDMKSQNVVARLDAVKIMAGINHELSVRALSAHIESEQSPQVRQECIKALTTLGMEEGLPVIENALSDETGLVRMAAVWGLYRLAGPQSGTALAGMLSDKDEGVRRRAVACIGWLGKSRFALDLATLLDDESILVRRAAAEAMGNLGNPQVVMSLIEHLKDPDKETRKIILCAIEKITGKKIGKSFPANNADLNRLVARWRQWWKEDMLK